MYSICVFLKNNQSICLEISSAASFSVIYQPTKTLNLPLLSNFWEDNDLIYKDEFVIFIQEIGKVVEYWENPQHSLNIENNLKDRLNEFYKQISKIVVNDILSIAIF